MPQSVGVLGVLVAGGDHQHTEPQDVGPAVDATLRGARVGHAGGRALGDSMTGFDLSERKHAAIRRELAAVEAGDEAFAADW